MTNIVVQAVATLTNLPPSTAQDAAKLLSDFHFNITPEGVAQVAGAIFLIARLLRKAIPDNMQTGVVGTALKHAALEVNPGQPAVTVQPTTSTATAPVQKVQ